MRSSNTAERPFFLDKDENIDSYSVHSNTFPFKRGHPRSFSAEDNPDRGSAYSSSHLHRHGVKKSFQFRGTVVFYVVVSIAVVMFLTMQTSIVSILRPVSKERSFKESMLSTNTLWFNSSKLLAKLPRQRGLDQLRLERRPGIRQPRLAIVLGSMRSDPSSLLFLSVAKMLQSLGYKLMIYSLENGEVLSSWKQIGLAVSFVGSKGADRVDWLMFEGILISSLQAKEVISSLMQEPYLHIPVIWTIMEDRLGKRLVHYGELECKGLLDEWRSAFSRAGVMVFPDFTLAMVYGVLDSGNFFVVPGSPVDIWSTKMFLTHHSKFQVRTDHGFHANDLVIVVGSTWFYHEIPMGYRVILYTIGSLLVRIKQRVHSSGTFVFVFLVGSFSGSLDRALQGIAFDLGLPKSSVKQYSMEENLNDVLLMSDVVVYGNFHEEQSFPPLLARAMTFGVPIVVPDLDIIKKHIVDGIHGIIFRRSSPLSLEMSFSLLLSGVKTSKFADVVGFSGRLHVQDMMATECILGYVRLLENVLEFPSDSSIPGPIPESGKQTWDWSLLSHATSQQVSDSQLSELDVVSVLEMQFACRNNSKSDPVEKEIEMHIDELTLKDWNSLREIERLEEFEKLELEELEERVDRSLGSWEDIYHQAKKSEKINIEANERDEGELERIGQLICVYEIYDGRGAWQFLHHGSLYRGLSLSTRERRARPDDVDAVARLQLLSDRYYKDILCELGAMFSIAMKVDSIHKAPWIGFQSWRAEGMKLALSITAENKLAEIIQRGSREVIYYWVDTRTDPRLEKAAATFEFWALCDSLNAGYCRELFAKAFRHMYSLPDQMETLPPMPHDGDHWSTLHSWIMPTSSFLEFIMFSRIFIDSLDGVSRNLSIDNQCILGLSVSEKKHCYCRMLELLVNVWAYHSARKMIYVIPSSGDMKDQHPVHERKGSMWLKYFNSSLLKEMDEDLAEAADDGDYPRKGWLWPLTGEIHWPGIYEKEREERYRQKMDKKRKTKEKLLERQKYGYKQKTLGGP